MTQHSGLPPIAPLPAWAASRMAMGPEDKAMQAGAILSHVQAAVSRPDMPLALLRDRLAMRAAEKTCDLLGRSEGIAALRDQVCLLGPGDQPGPAGQICLAWRSAVARPISANTLSRALPEHGTQQVAAWLELGRSASAGNPVSAAATVLEAVLNDHPRAEVAALVLADAALGRAVGWTHLVPLLATGARSRMIAQRGADLRQACYAALHMAARDLIPMAAELERRAIRLREVTPRLRSKGAEKAVDLLLARDAIAATDLTFLTGRSARRFCERVVALGVVRELTGRDTYRLYGV